MIQIQDLSKTFGNKTALRHINLTLEEGEIYGLMGENGAGKSTLFRCISGLNTYEGMVTMPSKYTIGYLPDIPFFYSCVKGVEYIEFCLKAKHIPIRKAMIDELNQSFQLPLNDFASEYSLGMKKRLSAMALILQQNDFYILDEPFNGLDLAGCLIMKKWLRSLRQTGKTALISSHIISSLTDICNHIAYIHAGEVVKDYTGMSATAIEKDIESNYMNI